MTTLANDSFSFPFVSSIFVEFKGNAKALQGNLTIPTAVKHVDQKRAVLDCSGTQRNF